MWKCETAEPVFLQLCRLVDFFERDKNVAPSVNTSHSTASFLRDQTNYTGEHKELRSKVIPLITLITIPLPSCHYWFPM